MKLQQFKHQNQFIIRGEGETVFQSYNSTIAVIKNGVLTLGSDWDYSQTTLRHLYMFFDEIARYECDYINNSDLFDKILNAKNKKAFVQNLIDVGLFRYSRDI